MDTKNQLFMKHTNRNNVEFRQRARLVGAQLQPPNRHTEKQELVVRFAMAALPSLIQIDARKGEAELREDRQPIPEDVTSGYDNADRWRPIANQAFAIAEAMISRLECGKPQDA